MADIQTNKDSRLIEANLGVPVMLHCIPADSTAKYGWGDPLKTPEGVPINDGKGTALTAAQKYKGAVYVPLRKVNGVATPTIARLRRAQDSQFFFGSYDHTVDPFRFSSIHYLPREWVSEDVRTRVFAGGSVVVNGVDKGTPGSPASGDSVLWAMVYDWGPTPETKSKHIFAVVLDEVTKLLKFYRRPLAGDTETAATLLWEILSVFDLSAVYTIPSMADAYKVPRKIVVNKSRTVVTVCLFGLISGAYIRPAFLDVDPSTGDHTLTNAEVPTITERVQTVVDGNSGSTTTTRTWAGKWQIDLDYVDDTKLFTEIVIANHNESYFSEHSDGTPPNATAGSSVSTGSQTDSRTILYHLQRGDFSVVFFQESYSLDSSFTHNYSWSSGGIGSSASASFNYSTNRALTDGSLLYFGGNGGLFVHSRRILTQTVDQSGSNSTAGSTSVNVPFTEVATLHNDFSIDLHHGLTVVNLAATSDDRPHSVAGSNLYTAPETSSTASSSTDVTTESEAELNSAWFGFYSPYPRYKPYTAADGDGNWIDERSVGDFTIASMWKFKLVLGTDTYGNTTKFLTQDPTKYYLYCTDSTLLSEYKLATSGDSGVLKHIQLVSPIRA